MHVTRRYGQEHYYCLFDEIPEITYEKIGSSYVGSATDNNETSYLVITQDMKVLEMRLVEEN